MRKFIVPLVAVFAVAGAAVPAAAAPGWRVQPGVQRQIQNDINQLDRKISRAVQRRTVSQREATGLRREAMGLQRTYNLFSRNGLDRREVAQLESQVNRLNQRLRLERRDRDNRRG
jgi:Spy/CpxP family protein refolding chaperone